MSGNNSKKGRRKGNKSHGEKQKRGCEPSGSDPPSKQYHTGRPKEEKSERDAQHNNQEVEMSETPKQLVNSTFEELSIDDPAQVPDDWENSGIRLNPNAAVFELPSKTDDVWKMSHTTPEKPTTKGTGRVDSKFAKKNVDKSVNELSNIGTSTAASHSTENHTGKSMQLESHWSGNRSNFKNRASPDDPVVDRDIVGPRYISESNSSSVDLYYKKGSKSNITRQNYNPKKRVDNFDDYDRNFRFKDMVYERVSEVEGDLFSAGKEYALAHCVAEDMNMGSGIALTFRKTFKCVDELLDQKERQGGLAYLNPDDRYIYYLVTKRDSSKKPTLETLFKSVNRLKDHMVENKVNKLAIPRIGCGLDRLEWSEVKNMLEYVFKDTGIEIKVFNYQQNYGKTKQKLVTKSCEVDKSKKKSKGRK